MFLLKELSKILVRTSNEVEIKSSAVCKIKVEINSYLKVSVILDENEYNPQFVGIIHMNVQI